MSDIEVTVALTVNGNALDEDILEFVRNVFFGVQLDNMSFAQGNNSIKFTVQRDNLINAGLDWGYLDELPGQQESTEEIFNIAVENILEVGNGLYDEYEDFAIGFVGVTNIVPLQAGGGKCSLCGAEGTNKSSCPLNPLAKNPNYKKHNALRKPITAPKKAAAAPKKAVAASKKAAAPKKAAAAPKKAAAAPKKAVAAPVNDRIRQTVFFLLQGPMTVDMGNGTSQTKYVSDVLSKQEMNNIISTIPTSDLETFVRDFFYGVELENFELTEGGLSAQFNVTRQSLNEANRHFFYLNDDETPLETADMTGMMESTYTNIMDSGKGDRLYLIEINEALEGGDLEELYVTLLLGKTQMA